MGSLARISLIVCLLLAGPVWATDYYADSACGTDGDGTTNDCANGATGPMNSFATVKTKFTAMSAGDTIHLKKGSVWTVSVGGAADTYWSVISNGSEGAHKTVRGDDYGTGDPPILRRSTADAECGANTQPSVWIDIAARYVTLRDFVLDGNSVNKNMATTGIVFSQWTSRGTYNVNDVTIKNMKVMGGGGKTGAESYVCGIWIATAATVENVLIENNEVRDYNTHGLNFYGGGTYNNCTFRGNKVHTPFTTRSTDVTSGIQIQPQGSGNVFEYNYVNDTTAAAGSAILTFSSGDIETPFFFRWNYIDGSATQAISAGYSTTTKYMGDFYGNIITGAIGAGFVVWSANFTNDSVINIYNNTFYDNGGNGIYLSGGVSGMAVNVRNNIIYPTGSGDHCISVASDFVGTFAHSYNHYWHGIGTAQYAIYDARTSQTDYTIANIKTLDANAQNTDPLFTNTGTGDFSVGATSDAIDHGTTSGSPTGNASGLYGAVEADFQAMTVNSDNITTRGTYDIGAYEYVIAGSTPTFTGGSLSGGSLR